MNVAPQLDPYTTPSDPRQSLNLSRLPPPSLPKPQGPGGEYSMDLPPLRSKATLSRTSISPASVPSILNPSTGDDIPLKRRRNASEPESFNVPSTRLPPLMTGSRNEYGVVASRSPSSPTSGKPLDPGVRRFLTPKSPSLNPSTTVTQLGRPTGTISAKEMPFLPASPHDRPYRLGTAAQMPPLLPTPPPGARQSYGFPPPAYAGQTTHPNIEGAPNAPRPISSDISPRASYQVYGGTREATPISQYASSYVSESDTPQDFGNPHRQLHIGVPISSSGGQGVYQMMTVSAGEGNVVHLPVDVQAASRVADEKRKRNAGASARFRQRRKEKEKESSTEIARLQQQVKDLTEDVDHYRRERDYLEGIVLQNQSNRRLQRPMSPRHRRAMRTTPEQAATAKREHCYDQEDTSDDGRHQGRRQTPCMPRASPNHLHTSIPQHGTQYTPTYGLTVYDNADVQAPSLTPRSLRPASSQPSLSREVSIGKSSAIGPLQLMQAPPQTGPANPFATDRRASNGG
ncbi:hypothetical protein MRB53_041488 [Persea americana]|nr:hypothetical protein MRB53_041488 [Persea americana]